MVIKTLKINEMNRVINELMKWIWNEFEMNFKINEMNEIMKWIMNRVRVINEMNRVMK